MRTYAPAEPDAVLAELLAEPSLARGVVHHAVIPPRAERPNKLIGLVYLGGLSLAIATVTLGIGLLLA